MFKLACLVLLCTIAIVQCQGNSRYVDLYHLRTFCCCLDRKPGPKPDKENKHEEGPAPGEEGGESEEGSESGEEGEESEEGSESSEEYGGPGKRPPPPHGQNKNDAGKSVFELVRFFNSNTVLFTKQYSFSN